MLGISLPFLANSAGWVFTEAGRQPWIVYGLMKTDAGVSAVSSADVATTLVVFVLLYTLLGAIDATLMVRAARHSLDDPEQHAKGAMAAGIVY
jgi:cytochrome d ubiquinol oxidase subunit I